MHTLLTTVEYLKHRQSEILEDAQTKAQTASGVLRAYEAIQELEHCIQIELEHERQARA